MIQKRRAVRLVAEDASGKHYECGECHRMWVVGSEQQVEQTVCLFSKDHAKAAREREWRGGRV